MVWKWETCLQLSWIWLLHGVLEMENKCTAVSGSGGQVSDSLQDPRLH
jgi:hypothetical protein